jgi:hypothetical protein
LQVSQKCEQLKNPAHVIRSLRTKFKVRNAAFGGGKLVELTASKLPAAVLRIRAAG